MKIGIFIQGQLRRSDEELLTTLYLLKDAFPNSEFCYSLWDTEYESRKEFCDSHLTGNLEIYSDFDIGYEPYLDNADVYDDYQYRKKLENPNPPRHPHQTKQILLHDRLMQKYGHRYDVIVRTRWDTTISPLLDFDFYVKECYNTPTVVAMQQREMLVHTMLSVVSRCSDDEPYLMFKNEDGSWRGIDVTDHCMLADSGIIMHRSDDWNSDFVNELHNTKKLLAAEFGWYQALVNGTTHHRWVMYTGGAALTRCISKTEKKIIQQVAHL